MPDVPLEEQALVSQALHQVRDSDFPHKNLLGIVKDFCRGRGENLKEIRKEGDTKNIKKSRFYKEIMKPRANTQKEMCESQKCSVASSSL